MSEESTTPNQVERTRRDFEALSRRDMDGFMGNWATHVVVDLNAWGIGTFEGAPAARVLFEDWQGNYEAWQIEAEEILDLGDGVVFVAYREVARPLNSAGHLERRQAMVSAWAEGKLIRLTGYTDINEARAAAERLAVERG